METLREGAKAKKDFEAIVKVTSVNKLLPNEIVTYLEKCFDIQPTSPLMYSENTDKFFLYVRVMKRRE